MKALQNVTLIGVTVAPKKPSLSTSHIRIKITPALFLKAKEMFPQNGGLGDSLLPLPLKKQVALFLRIATRSGVRGRRAMSAALKFSTNTEFEPFGCRNYARVRCRSLRNSFMLTSSGLLSLSVLTQGAPFFTPGLLKGVGAIDGSFYKYHSSRSNDLHCTVLNVHQNHDNTYFRSRVHYD